VTFIACGSCSVIAISPQVSTSPSEFELKTKV
jgi:hypothetical protein